MSTQMTVSCSQCGTDMVYLGDKIEIPQKRDDQGWDSLREWLGQVRRNYEQATFKQWVRRRHDLEQEIERLASMPANPGRTKAISLLRKQLDAL